MKNLKMFAIALLAMLVMVSGVKAACNQVSATKDGLEICYTSLGAALADVDEPDDDKAVTVEIKLSDTYSASESAALTLKENVNYVIDLNGKTVTLNNTSAITIADKESVTVKSSEKGGIITGTGAALFTLTGGSLTIEENVAVNVTGSYVAIAATGADADAAPVVNIKGGTVSSAADDAISITNAVTLNMTDGTISAVSTGKHAVVINANDEDLLPTIKISGGEITSSSSNTAMSLTGANSKDALDANKGNVTGGKFSYGVLTGISVGSGTLDDEAVLAILVGDNATFTKSKTTGVVTVTAKATQEPEPQQPGTTEPGDQTTGDGNQGGTDNVKNPETNDNILVYAGLGLVSLASVAFTAKKRED